MKLVDIKNVCKKYQTKNSEIEALNNINFSINEGDIIAIVGPSGCGKSTILSILSNLENYDKGEIITYKKDLKYGYMFQHDTLFDWISVMDNCMLGPKINKSFSKKDKDECLELLDRYGLSKFKDNYPSSLSGGMRQRVALIRTLMTKPDILLLDEPFSALDYQNRLLISNDVYKIIKEKNITTLMVTHDVSEACAFADIVIVLTDRPTHVKSIHKIIYDKKEDPINNRLKPIYNIYCNKILGELNVI
ncbi:MAG: ABC transporter ATP-binding protein [bacterium]|nr:ABC transporter ATP-binding protein [bacterium]